MNRLTKILVILLLLGGKPIFGGDQNKMQLGLSARLSRDTSTTVLRLPNPFLSRQGIQLPPGYHQRLQSWIFQHRNRITGAVSLPGQQKSGITETVLPQIDWSTTVPGGSAFGLDYRESSLFVPVEVREYLDYKMGRSRYIPLGSLAMAMFLADRLYRRYGYLLHQREENRYRGLELEKTEIEMLSVLWKTPGLSAVEWYQKFSKAYSHPEITFLIFKGKVDSLREKYLLKTRTFSGGKVKYFPALTRQELILKLKDEQVALDGAHNPHRLQRLRELIDRLSRL